MINNAGENYAENNSPPCHSTEASFQHFTIFCRHNEIQHGIFLQLPGLNDQL